MFKRLVFLWIMGLVTLVPYGTWYLFTRATRDEYAFLTCFVLFWVFGLWGVAGPLVSALKVRSVINAFQKARSADEIKALLHGDKSRDMLVDLIAPRTMCRDSLPGAYTTQC
jgi:hypothetical protein